MLRVLQTNKLAMTIVVVICMIMASIAGVFTTSARAHDGGQGIAASHVEGTVWGSKCQPQKVCIMIARAVPHAQVFAYNNSGNVEHTMTDENGQYDFYFSEVPDEYTIQVIPRDHSLWCAPVMVKTGSALIQQDINCRALF